MDSLNNKKSFTVYQASAGSGKTYTLAKEYIKLCLIYYPKDPFVYRKILGITFTNKAVNEMKERILLFLEMLALETHENLLTELSEDVEKSEIPIRAKAILSLIHHDYSNFSIYTIDSLFQQIVQSFAIDLKIPINHQLELDTDTMMALIVDLILSKLGYDHDVTEAVLNFSFSNIEDEKNWHIERELAKTGREIYKETAIPYLKKLESIEFKDFDIIIKQINTKIAIIENSIRAAAENACKAISENGIQFSDFYQGLKGVGQWFYKRSQGDFNLSANSYVLKAVKEDLWYSSTCKNKEAIEAAAPVLKENYFEIAAKEQDYKLLKAIRRNIYPVVLLNEIKRTSEDLKRNDNLLHISEANFSIFESIKDEPVAFVYERIGERYKYIFIDEFQDTSHLQWQNILPLVVEVLSTSLFERELGKVIIFGDAKQAIYRFRGGDVLQFVRLPNLTQSDQNTLVKEQENILQYNYEKIFLQKNYRSKKEIVDFNNSFFEYLTKDEDDAIKGIYSNSFQEANADNIGGAVSLSCLLKNEETQTAYIDFVHEEICRIILSVLSDNYSYSDIVILVRGNDFGADIARELVKNGIPTVSGESLLLSMNKEVSFLIACLSYLTDKNNSIASAAILSFVAEKQGLSKENILVYAKNNVQFHQFLQDCKYDFSANKLAKQNLYERVEQLLQIFDLTKDANPFILAFLDVVADFVKSGNKTDSQFLNYWKEKENKFSLSNPKGTNAVTVMTIHQSKGLEFPIVIYPHKKNSNNMGEKWVDLQSPIANLTTTVLKVNDMQGTAYDKVYEQELQSILIDDLNVDYVAFTRAKDRLYFISRQEDKRGEAMKKFLQDSNISPLVSQDGTIENYCFGNPQAFPDNAGNIAKKEFSLENYVSKPITASLSVAKHEHFWEKETVSSSTLWGTLAHNYLAKIYYREDIDPILQKIQHDATLPEDKKQNLKTLIHNVFFHSQSDVLFGTQNSVIKNEVELVDVSGNGYRIDRLCINDTKCAVFEYKTGIPNESHLLQINQYDSMLSDAGFEVTDKYLIYIDDDFGVKFERL